MVEEGKKEQTGFLDPEFEELEQLVLELRRGDSEAARAVFPQVSQRMRDLARVYMYGERKDHTLQTTALVNEAFLRVFGNPDRETHFKSLKHFFVRCSLAMQRVLVDYARERNREKRRPLGERTFLDDLVDGYSNNSMQLVDYEDLVECLREENSLAWEVTQLHVIMGLSFPEIASLLDESPGRIRTAWGVAKDWLRRRCK